MGDDQDAIQRSALRRIWKRRDEITPSKSGTWGEWFYGRFGRTTEEAARDYAERRTRQS